MNLIDYRNNQEIDRIIKKVDADLNEENRDRFRAMDQDMKRKVVMEMMGKGVVNIGH